MWRFVFILVICAGLAPLIPDLLAGQFDFSGERRTKTAHISNSAEDRTHRISADRRGQFVADVGLNGRRVEMLVDTGATATALPESIAEDIGIYLKNKDFKYRVGTANGVTFGARAVIDQLEIGTIYLKNIEAIVLRDESLGEPLLGMSALNKLGRFDISSGTLVLVQ